MWTITDPKSTRIQCDAAVPSRPIGFVRSSRRLPMIPSAIAPELPFRAARADDEVVGHRRQADEVEQDDVRSLLVLGQLDDPPGELQRRPLGGGRRLGALGQAVGTRCGHEVGGKGGFGHDLGFLRWSMYSAWSPM